MEDTIKDIKQPDDKKAIDDIDRANEVADRLERANKKKEELLLREEKLAVQRTLGGRSDAGDIPKVLSEEEKEKEECRKLLPKEYWPVLDEQ